MKIPTKEQCIELLKKYDVPENIIKHSVKVSEVAMFLGQKLYERKIKIDLSLLQAAAILHDLDKIESGQDMKKHGRPAYDNITTEGYLGVAGIVIKHNSHSLLNGDMWSWEEVILNYAEKRVIEDRVVSLRERFDYLKVKYPDYYSAHEDYYTKTKEYEDKIFKLLEMKPEDLKV